MASKERTEVVRIANSNRHARVIGVLWAACSVFGLFVRVVVIPVAQLRALHPTGGLDVLIFQPLATRSLAWLSVICFVAFAVLAGAAYYNMRKVKPLLEIDELGITYRQLWMSWQIKWSQISAVKYRQATILESWPSWLWMRPQIVINIILKPLSVWETPGQKLLYVLNCGILRILQSNFEVHPGFVLEQMAKRFDQVQLWEKQKPTNSASSAP